MSQRYTLKQGKFGMYFYDELPGREMSLEEVLWKLNWIRDAERLIKLARDFADRMVGLKDSLGRLFAEAAEHLRSSDKPPEEGS